MVENLGTHGDGTEPCPGGRIAVPDIRQWFIREVFPYEGALMQYLHQNWRGKADIEDLRQEVYLRVFEAASHEIPKHPKTFLLRTAQNLLIDRVRREQVVPIAAVADLDALGVAVQTPGPERNIIAKDILRRLQTALDKLPPRCREAVVLRQIEGLSYREISTRMGISQDTVAEHLANGIAALADALYGDLTDLRRGL